MLMILLAAAADPPPVAAPAPPAPPVEKIICRSEPVVNSRIRTSKTCRTAKEWMAFYRGHDDVARQISATPGDPYAGR